MNRCKHCKVEILFPLSGLRDFCSEECKKTYRRMYCNQKKREKRNVHKSEITSTNQGVKNNVENSGYIDINHEEVHKSKPYPEPFYKGQNGGSETFESYGGKEWYSLAKNHCCNFDLRRKEGYCVTLTEPCLSFKMKCSECSLAKKLRGIKWEKCIRYISLLKSASLDGNKARTNNQVRQKLNKRLFTIEEAAEYLGRTPRAVRDMIYAGKLNVVKIDRRTQIDINDMDSLIENSKDQCFN